MWASTVFSVLLRLRVKRLFVATMGSNVIDLDTQKIYDGTSDDYFIKFYQEQLEGIDLTEATLSKSEDVAYRLREKNSKGAYIVDGSMDIDIDEGPPECGIRGASPSIFLHGWMMDDREVKISKVKDPTFRATVPSPRIKSLPNCFTKCQETWHIPSHAFMKSWRKGG